MADLPTQDPKIGVDEWVARSEERTHTRGGRIGEVERALRSVPVAAWLVAALALMIVYPFLTKVPPLDSQPEYYERVAVNTLILILLALGLNVVVGWAGLLDLGYVAFYGLGAYAYAMLASDHFGVHLPALATLAIIVPGCALVGLLIGLTSRRLLGDYLAIVTLFVAQIFVVLVNNSDRIKFPWNDQPTDVTGGPNGIGQLDQLDFWWWEPVTPRDYYYVALVAFALVVTVLWLVNNSRTGRAWRSLREDPLAAQLLGMPVNWLKLMAFSFGAAIAGMIGAIFAALQNGVFPGNFGLELLIMIYAIVILGGAGSITGVVLGAIVLNTVLEVLRLPGEKEGFFTSFDARELFYVVVALGLAFAVRPWQWLVGVVGGVIALGFAVNAIVTNVWPEGTKPDPFGQQSRDLSGWVVELTNPTEIGSWAYAVLIAAVLGTTLLKGWHRKLALIPLIYLAAFVWENKLVLNPSVTRLIFLGALLIALMNVRPQGLLGTSRVEIT